VICFVCGHPFVVPERVVDFPAPWDVFWPFPAVEVSGVAHGDCAARIEP
jgi:hypothetical protein